MTEKLLTGTLSLNTNKQSIIATYVIIESYYEKNSLCDLRITNVIPTVPISESPRLLQVFVDEGSGLSCFLMLQIMRHYLS